MYPLFLFSVYIIKKKKIMIYNIYLLPNYIIVHLP